MKMILLMLFTFFYTMQSLAFNCSNSERKLTIYFSNGMFTDDYDAQSALSDLAKPVSAQLLQSLL